jgi:hypothetical protein
MNDLDSRNLERIATALETIAEYSRMMAAPTTQELQTRLQRSIETAKFLDKLAPAPDEAFN